MARKREFDLDKIETKAMELFWKQGYEGTSLLDLTSHLGIGKGSFYNTFAGKQDLFLRSFRRYIRTIGMEALKPLTRSGDIMELLRTVFQTVALQITRDPLHRGCLMVNTITEMSGKDPTIEAVVLAARDEMRLMFRDALASRWPDKAEEQSWILLNLFLGLRVLAKSAPTLEQVQPIIEASLSSIG